jgi:hypothetical protein
MATETVTTPEKPAATGSQDTTPAPEATSSATPPADFDAYLATLDEPTKALVSDLTTKWHDAKVTNLKGALDKERDGHEKSSKELRDLAKTADAKTAEALNKLAAEKDAELDQARKESAFYRDAATAGVPADKLARAWLICRNADFFTKRGEPDIAAMKTELPELFAQPAGQPRVAAGAGTQQAPAAPEVDPLRLAVARAKGVSLP